MNVRAGHWTSCSRYNADDNIGTIQFFRSMGIEGVTSGAILAVFGEVNLSKIFENNLYISIYKAVVSILTLPL